jgi:peptidoglycan/xylan/chitin deacetylase (PgdA/CDA1 family)
LKVVIFFILFGLLTFGQKKQVCFSFDDLPVVSYGITDTFFQKELIDNLISGLEKDNIPAIGFVNEKKLYNKDGKVNQFQVELLKNWAVHDLELGNHTFSHPDYNLVSFKDFKQDLLKGETITKEILSKKKQSNISDIRFYAWVIQKRKLIHWIIFFQIMDI